MTWHSAEQVPDKLPKAQLVAAAAAAAAVLMLRVDAAV